MGLKDTVLNLKKEGQSTLSQAIQKRNEIEKCASLFLESVQTAIAQLKQENKRKLDEMLPLLEHRGRRHVAGPSYEQEEQGHFITELISLLEQSTSQDNIESLKEKMAVKYCSLNESELALASDEMAEMESLLSFFQSWSLRQVGGPDKPDAQQQATADGCDSTIGAADSGVNRVNIRNLILSLIKSRIYIGEVLIRPLSNTPFVDFFNQLGELLTSSSSSDFFSISTEKVKTLLCMIAVFLFI